MSGGASASGGTDMLRTTTANSSFETDEETAKALGMTLQDYVQMQEDNSQGTPKAPAGTYGPPSISSPPGRTAPYVKNPGTPLPTKEEAAKRKADREEEIRKDAAEAHRQSQLLSDNPEIAEAAKRYEEMQQHMLLMQNQLAQQMSQITAQQKAYEDQQQLIKTQKEAIDRASSENSKLKKIEEAVARRETVKRPQSPPRETSAAKAPATAKPVNTQGKEPNDGRRKRDEEDEETDKGSVDGESEDDDSSTSHT